MSWKLDIEQQITDLNRRVSELESKGKKDGERVKETPRKNKKISITKTKEK